MKNEEVIPSHPGDETGGMGSTVKIFLLSLLCFQYTEEN